MIPSSPAFDLPPFVIIFGIILYVLLFALAVVWLRKRARSSISAGLERSDTALAEERNLLRTIIDLLPFEIFIKDLECRYILNNQMHARLLGVSDPVEALDKTAFDFYPPDVAAEYRKDDLRIMQSGEAMLDQERRSKGAAGEQRWRQVSKVPLRDTNGKVIGLVGISRDITERKQADEETARRTRELATLNKIGRTLSRLTKSSEILQVIYTAIGQVLDDKNFYIALYDEPNQLLSFPIYTIGGERIERESRKLTRGLTERVILTKSPVFIPRNMKQARERLGLDSLGKPAQCYLAVPMLSGDKVLGVIAVQDYENENVYDSNHAELLATFAAQAAIAFENARLFEETQNHLKELSSLREAAIAVSGELELSRVLDRIVEIAATSLGIPFSAIFLLDEASGRLSIQAGHGLSERYMREIEPVQSGTGIVGRAVAERKPTIAEDMQNDSAMQSLSHNLQVSLEEGIRSILSVPMLAKGKPIGAMSVYSRTPQKFSDEQIRLVSTFADQAAIAVENARLYRESERRAHELEQANRALEENQEKLVISEKMASLGRLTAGIAHEMNTPLAAVRTSLVELERLAREYHDSMDDPQVTPDDHKEIAREMQNSIALANSASARAADFVRGIKAQTRDLAQQEHRRFNAVPVIREALLLLNHALRKGNCTALFEPPDEFIELYGAPGRFAQVITNLVTNAIDATKNNSGGPITVNLIPGSGEVKLQISDSGSGIAPEILPKIFDPMFTTKPFGEGTGLGLSILHDIVVGEFGGTIAVESELGHGATFILRFPNRKESEHAAHSQR